MKERVAMDMYAAKSVCHLCLKGFSSGKALGGHMRIHKKNKEDAEDDDHNCVICGRDFPSRKSLYGHMRSHPGRGWKGVNPPSFCSYLKSVAAVDLTASLKGWPVTAERGRRATASSQEEEEVSSSPVDAELMDAVNYLLMLSSGNNVAKEEEKPVGNDPNDDRRRICDGEFESIYNKNKRRRLKKKKKKVKLSELEMSGDVGVSAPGADKKYKCDMCYKFFSSHQAYGGHRSSHNKVKAFVTSSSPGQPKEALWSRVAASPVWRRGVGFDLNEVPPVSGFELL